MDRAPDQWRGGHHIAADDDHHHLHGEGNQGPKIPPGFDAELSGAFARQDAQRVHHQDAQEREDQRVGKPALAPAGEGQSHARNAAVG